MWIGGNGPSDRQLLKFTNDGNFIKQLGHPSKDPVNSADTTILGRPAGIEIDEAAHELYISDGYMNKRVIVYDSDTLAFKRMWGAYGNVPNDADPGPYKGKVLKKLKPDPNRDDLSDLLHCAAVSARSDAIRYLLEIGANPNDKPNGGSSALDTCLWHLNFSSSSLYYRKNLRSKYEVSKGLDSAREVTAHGAIWNPNDQSAFNDLRRALYGCEPEVTIELLQIFKKHNACPQDRLKELLCKPRMKEHLASQTYWLTRLGLKYEEKRRSKEWTPPRAPSRPIQPGRVVRKSLVAADAHSRPAVRRVGHISREGL